MGDGLNILDVGGRYQPYRPLFGSRMCKYVAVDLIKTELVTVIASGDALPFAPATFDVAVGTQVFEYFEDPHGAAKQIHAALKPGGILLASVAACVPRIVDDEHWRFTPSGLRSVFAPFARVDILPEVGNLGSFLRLTNLALNSFLPWKPVRQAYNVISCPLVNIVGLGLEALHLTKNDQFASGYSVRAVKGK